MMIAPKISKYFILGNRTYSVYHCRIRNKCSNLNDDLFNNHLKPTAICDCQLEIENAEHYFFRCERYNEQRLRFFHLSRKFHPLGVNLVLYGSDNWSENDNLQLFTYVQQYIRDTARF